MAPFFPVRGLWLRPTSFLAARAIAFLLLGAVMSPGARAQMMGSVSSDSETPHEVKVHELQAQVLSGNVDLFTGRYSASYPLGTVATPGGLGFQLALQYSPTIVGTTVPTLTEGVPYGAGWNVNVPTITVSNAYRHYYTEDRERYILEHGACALYPCTDVTLDSLDEMTDGEGYWYAPMVNIPGVASGRAVFQRVDHSEAIFVLNTFEQYIELRFDGAEWTAYAPDGKVYTFGRAEVNVRMPSNQRALDYEELNDYVGAADPDGLDAQLAQLKVRNSILPKEVTCSWTCTSIADPVHLPKQFIRFEYDAFGEFDYYQELGQENYNLWLYNEFFSLGDDDSAYYYFGSPLLSLARVSAARDLVLRSVSATTTEGEMARLELDYAVKNDGTEGLLPPSDPLDPMYGRELVWDQGGPEKDLDGWVRFVHMRSDGIPWGGAHPESRLSPTDPYVTLDGDRYSIALGADEDLDFDHGVLESPRIDEGELLHPGDIYEIRTEIYNASGSPTHIGNLDINVFTGTGPAIVGGSTGTGFVDNDEYDNDRERVLFSTFDRAVKWNTNGGTGATLHTSNFFLMPDVPNGSVPPTHGHGDDRSFTGMTIQIGPANSDNDFSMGPDLDMPCANVEDALTYVDDNDPPLEHVSAYTTYLHQRWLRAALVGNVIGNAGIGLLSHHPLPHSFGVGLPWSMLLLPAHHLANAPAFQGDPVSNPMFAFWWNNGHCGALTHANQPTLFPPGVKLKRVEVWRYSKLPYLLSEVRSYVRNGSLGAPAANGMRLVGRTVVEHDADVQPIFRNLEYYPYEPPKPSGYKKNMLRLTALRQAPVDPSHDPPADLSATPVADMPSTVFTYDTAGAYIPAPRVAYDCAHLDSANARPAYLDYTWLRSPLLSRIVDPMGRITTIRYNDPTDPRYTETQYFDMSIAAFLDTTFCDQWTRILRGSLTMTPTVQCIYRSDETGDSARVTTYAYADKVHKPTRKSPNLHYRETRTELEEREYGYLTVTVTGPQNGVDGTDPIRNRTVHRFHGGLFFDTTQVDMGGFGQRVFFQGTHWPVDTTTDGREFLLFGKLKDSRQYDHDDRLLIEDRNTYTVSKAFDNGMRRPHYDVARLPQADDYVDYDTAFTLRPRPGTVPVHLEHDLRPYADNKFLETAGLAFPGSSIYHVDYPDIYLNSYFVALTRTEHTEHDPEGCRKDEPLVSDPPFPTELDFLDNPGGDGWTNGTVDPDGPARLTALNTQGLTTPVKNDLMTGPLDEPVLTKAIQKAKTPDAERLRDVLNNQPALTPARLTQLIAKTDTITIPHVRAVLEHQPYLPDTVLNVLFGSILPHDVVKGLLLQQTYLSSALLDTLLDHPAGWRALDLREVLLAQGRLPRPIVRRLLADTLLTDPMKADVLTRQDHLPPEVFDSLAAHLQDLDLNAVKDIVLYGPEYPDDDFLLALLDASPALSPDLIIAILRAAPHPHSGAVIAAVDGKQPIKEGMMDMGDWLDLVTDCSASCETVDLAITTYTDYSYYTARANGVTDAPGYKRLFGFGLDHAPFQLKWQPSWLLFSKKTWSPQYPSAYATDEYYYYQDLLERYDRHWSVLDDPDAPTWFHVVVDEEEVDTITGLPERLVYWDGPPGWDISHGDLYTVPAIEAIERLREFGHRTPVAYQHRSISKNDRDTVPLVRNDFHYYFGQWPELPYPYNTDSLIAAGDPCPADPVTTGGGGTGSTDHTGPAVQATYRTHAFSDGNWMDQLEQVPEDYALARRIDGGFFFVPFTLAEGIEPEDSLWTVYYRPWAPDSIYIPGHGVGGTREDVDVLNLKKAFQLRSSHLQADTLLTAAYDTAWIFPEEVPLMQFRPTDDGDPGTADLWAPVMPYATLDQGVVLERNAFQQPQLVEDERGLRTRYVYENKVFTWYHNPTTPCHNYQTETLYHPGKPTAIITGCGLPDSLVTYYRYKPDNSVDSIIDPNGMVLQYAYDDLGRLAGSYRNGDLLAAQEYSYWSNTAAHQGDDFFTRARANHVGTVQYLEAGDPAALVTRAYMDPLGRGYNTVAAVASVSDPTAVPQVPSFVSSGRVTYDGWDRAIRSYKPYLVQGGGTPMDLKATAAVVAATPALYASGQAELDPRGRPLAEAKVGETVGGAGHWVEHRYRFLDEGAFACMLGLTAAEAYQLMPHDLEQHVWRMAETTDEDGHTSRTFTNALGQQVATQAFITDSTAALTLFLFDSQGQVARVIDPEKHVSTYAYNLLGWLYRKATPDDGVTTYMYDRSGNVVLEQDAEGAAGEPLEGISSVVPTYRRYSYDTYNRLIRQERVRLVSYEMGDEFRTGEVWHSLASRPVSPLHYRTDTAGFYFLDGDLYLDTDTLPNPFTRYLFTPGSTLDWLATEEVLDNRLERHTVRCVDLVRAPIPEKEWYFAGAPGSTLGTLALTPAEWVYLLNDRHHLRGRLSHSFSYPYRSYVDMGSEASADAFDTPLVPHAYDLFSYDGEGHVSWELQQFNPNGIAPGSPGLVALLDYARYDLRGNLRTLNIDINADHRLDLQQHYVYDGWGRLTAVYAGHAGREAGGERLAAYAYDTAQALLTGATYFRRCKEGLADLTCDSIGYSYDVRDRLTGIDQRFYAEQLYYDTSRAWYQGIPLDGGRYWNGAINASRGWYHFSTPPAPGVVTGLTGYSLHGYSYDGLGRLVHADGLLPKEVSGISDRADPHYRVGDESCTYDRIGNLRTLARWGYYDVGGGPELLQEAWSYGYQVNADRLLHLSPVGDPGLAHRYYGYNATGDLLTDSYRLRTSTTIGRGHLPWTFMQTNEEEDLLRGTYLYDVGDQRIYKRYEGPGRIKVGKVLASSWHLRDAGGREVGVLDLETGRWAWYVFGAQRFARVQPNNGSQQPAFYSGDLGELGGLSQEGDEYQDLLDLLLELAGADEELDYPLTVHRVVLTGGAVLFLSDTAWSALQGQGTPVDDEEPWTFNSGTNEVTVAHAGGSVTLSIEALLGEGAHGGAPNANGFWYIYPADTTLHSVTYYEHDHLGNLRVAHTPMLSCTEDAPPVMDVAGSSYTLEHVLDYYPYGKVLRQYVNSQGPERYLTTQHERDQETGLDYRGARYYDSDVARFLSVDPLGGHEVQVDKSPYMYVWGNPVSITDPDGKCPTCPGGPLFFVNMLADGIKNPDGFGAHYVGASMGIVNHAQSTWNAITHPVQTVKTAMAAQQPGSPENIQATMGLAVAGNNLMNGNGFQRGEVIGGAAAGVVEGVVLSKGAGAMMRAAEATTVSNPVPTYVSRVVPGPGPHPTIGPPGAADAFVTAADDISGMTAPQIQTALTIDASPTGYTTYTFPTPNGVASPVFRPNPGFVGRGRTAGGAREFVVPNGSFPQGTTSTYIPW